MVAGSRKPPPPAIHQLPARSPDLFPALFPGRWPTAPRSPWHQAMTAGRITMRKIGPMRHMNGKDYFDRHETDDDGVSYRQLTVDALVEALGP